MNGAEVAANAFNAASILLAARNSVHTWWTGIVGCLLFAWVFFAARLYADVTLQAFFVVTSGLGWWRWVGRAGQHRSGAADVPDWTAAAPADEGLPVSRTPPRTLLALTAWGAVAALAYGALLHATTDAYAPFVDSVVLAASVIGQLLLMARRVETWWFWLLVDTIAVPLYLSRGLHLTAALFAVFWLNAWVGWWRWRRELAVAEGTGGAVETLRLAS